MPELPEVEIVRRGLTPHMVGRQIQNIILNRTDLRFPLPSQFESRLQGRTIRAFGRRAKYLIADLDDEVSLIMHLGMSGSFQVICANEDARPGRFHFDRGKDPSHDHVAFEMSGARRIVYNDPRRFGFMDLICSSEIYNHKFFKALGPEPFDSAFNAQALMNACAGKKTSIKAVLLDQRNVGGLGNIYVCEALHRAGVSPLTSAASLTEPARRARLGVLVDRIRSVLSEAIEAGGSTLRDHRLTDGSLGYFQHNFRVYDREGLPCPAPGCKGVIRRVAQGGRSSFFCPTCQK